MRCTCKPGLRLRALVAATASTLAVATLLGCSPVAPPPIGPSPSASPVPEGSTSSAAASGPQADVAAEVATVVRISDGDTIVTTVGKVRLIGIDTPEQGECGYVEAGEQAAALAPIGSAVRLVAVPGRDDTDRYGRLLRYVDNSGGIDLGMAQLTAGYAVARYDSRDGYGGHPREQQYIAADRAAPRYTCPEGDG